MTTRDPAARPTAAGRRPVPETRPRTGRDTLTGFLNGTLAVAALAAVTVPVLADDQAPEHGHRAPTIHGRIMDTRPDALPRWTPNVAHRFPGCTAVSHFKSTHPGTVPPRAIVVRQDGTVQPMTTDETFARATTGTRADDVWTIGLCAR